MRWLIPLLAIGCVTPISSTEHEANLDADRDGFLPISAGGTDCDDANPAVHPDAEEWCNGVDDNCDGEVDPDTARGVRPWWTDADGDGSGDSTTLRWACAVDGAAPLDGDCDDTDPLVNAVDQDGDGFHLCNGDCDDTNPYAWPGAPEWCGDGFDNDCSGAEDDNALDALTWYLDADADGFGGTSTALACEAPPDHTAVPGDCDDAVPEVFPGGTELCDGLDNDCNGDIDDDPVDPTPWYTDTDGDGYGDDASMVMACSGTLDVGGDCDDGDITVNPGALEVCGDGVDNDCDRTGCGLPQGDLDDDSAPLRIEGGTGFGASLAAGDLDGDGWDDLSVGEAGSAVHLFAGPLGAGSLTPQDAFATVLDGSGAETGLGQGSLVADVSGDGLADWVLAAPLTGMPTSADGALYALQGPLAPGGVDLSTASLSVMGPTTGGQLGHAMGLGALLGVGQSALVASAPHEPTGGAVYLFELPLTTATDTSAAFGTVLGFGAGDGWGSALTLSDWNGDGLVDLAVGAPGTANGDLCVFWGPIGAGSLAAADADLHWTGDAAGDALGSAIHAGDLNGDGATDLVVTSPGSDTVSIAWGPWFLASSPIGSAANVRVNGALSPEAQIHVGDLNHDGFDDLFVADPTAGTAAVDGGSAWVFFGPLTEDRTLDEADARIDGLAEGQSLGASLLVHDLDADGFVDLSLGAPTSDPANPTPSRTYHFFGASL